MESMGAKVVVVSDEKLPFEKVTDFTHFVLSPGPGLPHEKQNLFSLLKLIHSKAPILGVCLGMQGIASYLGADLYNLAQVKHGVQAEIDVVPESTLFTGLPERMNVGLYHSWAVKNVKGTGLKITAQTKEGVIMAIEDDASKLFGVQFHPESILTEHGKAILANFLAV
jgi:anthranilate synthase/aminodeoxychorismate synthase-like glutamine amidotransferase